MICSTCGHENQGNKFCVQCGTHLAVQQGEPSAPAVPATPAAPAYAAPTYAAPNAHLEQAKRVSKQYFSYFLQVLRHPYQTAQNVYKEQFTNGVISIVLLSLLYPLLVYIGISKFGNPPFGRFVIEPMIYFLIIFTLISAVIFAVVRLSGIAADFQSVAARFGTLLIPAVLCVAVNCVFFLLQMSAQLQALLFSLGLLFLFLSISAVIVSFRKQTAAGLDTLYALVIANVASGYIFYKIISLAAGAFGGYFPGFGGGYPF